MTAAARSLVAIVKDAPRPKLADRGRLMGIEELQELLPPHRGQKRTRWWFNHAFMPEKAVKVGRTSCWWECDVVAWLDGER